MEKVMLETHVVGYIFLPTAEYLSSNASNQVLKLDEQEEGQREVKYGPQSRRRDRISLLTAADSLAPSLRIL
ncbi:hypothetical protein FA13DRAFT_1743120 [Coprinellus micaceus]|uniref:Uncharacterized protein n=1 Tax=Coprinellus micaceus TaxID=71717 RepID=A0A4Y7SGS1_COPMI|nr:hypothetical protein FA13DRAFT_1743120 [Coprinellus micaceus]